MKTYNIGDKVHVEFDAVVTAGADCGIDRRFTWTLREDGGGGAVHYVYLHEDIAEVINPEPASWPPVVGDIWEADGVEYCVRAYFCNGVVVAPFSYGARPYYNSQLDEFKALRPVLVRRRLTFSETVFDTVSAYRSRLT